MFSKEKKQLSSENYYYLARFNIADGKMETNRKSFKKLFPNLSRELALDDNKVSIESVRTDPEAAEREATGDFENYTPTVTDFLRRCDTETQAEEIISYLEKRGELKKEAAATIRTRLRRDGLRSFGPKKEDDYYSKHGGLC